MAEIISIASGKGGVGKSMVASNLAVLLAKRGKRVILTDLDIGGANLHVLFGMFRPAATLSDFFHHRVKSLEQVAQPIQGYQGLRLIPGAGDTLLTANLQHAKKKRLIKHLHQLDADVVLVDVGAGTHYHALDFFLLADHYLTVGTPDPTSVLDLYRFVKLAAIRKVLGAFLARDPIAHALRDKEFQSVTEVLEAVGKTSNVGMEVAKQTIEKFHPYLILNQMTSGSRINTLHLQHLLKQYVGADLVVLGNVPHDASVQLSIHKFLPVVDFAPSSKATLALMGIIDRLLIQLERNQGDIAA